MTKKREETTENAEALTPMMRQFFTIKRKNPGTLLLFRCGDFYETYGDDAVDAAKILGITLTRRSNGRGPSADIAMAGFPYHAVDTYLPRLLRAGRRVAVCDQLEDPSTAKKLVKRGVTEIVTPGTAMTDGLLESKENNFLAAVSRGEKRRGAAFLDLSTGEFLIGEGDNSYVEKMLASFRPKEIVRDKDDKEAFDNAFGTRWCTYDTDAWAFNKQNAELRLQRHFGTTTLKGYGIGGMDDAVAAAGAVMRYLEMTQHTCLGHITAIKRIEESGSVRMDKYTIRSLELLKPMQGEGMSLMDIIDRTLTPMGGRMLRRRAVFPLRDTTAITRRHAAVERLLTDTTLSRQIDGCLRAMGDIERMTAHASTGRLTPRKAGALRTALIAAVPLKAALSHCDDAALNTVGQRIDTCDNLRQILERQLAADPPAMLSRGGVIAKGCNDELDRLRAMAEDGRGYLMSIQDREAQATGIASLKVGYNNVFGYYLEVRNIYKSRVPATWVRKQTLAQAERYITQELKEYEEQITGAEERIAEIERDMFASLIRRVQDHTAQLQTLAQAVAETDFLLSMAVAAREHGYVRPIVDDSRITDIRAGRHPVIEKNMPKGESYVPNDIFLDADTQQIIIVTGPNMSGKSALLRQTALITVMAQMGSFVPAAAARIGAVDKIFTRVGASDNLTAGESTFMVEMTEAADILNNVTPRSLVLFDELGRGTSTYDGISIARAVVEYLHEKPEARSRTLFATHYHELNDMEGEYERIKNYNVSVKESDGKVVFLRKLERGGSEHSFGIHVAAIAGMPKSIVTRAADILKQLEREAPRRRPTPSSVATAPTMLQETIATPAEDKERTALRHLRDYLAALDTDNITPIEALNKLYEIKKKAASSEDR